MLEKAALPHSCSRRSSRDLLIICELNHALHQTEESYWVARVDQIFALWPDQARSYICIGFWRSRQSQTYSSSTNLKPLMSHLRTTFHQLPSSSCPGSDHIAINTEDPEYYAELFCKIPRVANWRIHSSCPVVPGIQGFDDPLGRRLQTLLDAVADISLCQRGNFSATMASLKDHHGSTETQFYIVFNHENDDAAGRCSEHLQAVFGMLRQVPYKQSSTDGSPKIMSNELENYFLDICRAIHDYSFDIFAYRVLKRESKLSKIQRYIEEDQTRFSTEQRETLLEFLTHVDSIIQIVRLAIAHPTKPLSTGFIQMLLWMYSYWTEHNLLPDDSLPDNKLTLLDAADTWLASSA